MPVDMATPSVQSLIDKFEQLAARSSGHELLPARRRRRVRCLSDATAFPAIERDDIRMRRLIPAKLSMDMTSTTSTTSISSDDEGDDEEDVDVDANAEADNDAADAQPVDSEASEQKEKQVNEQPSEDADCNRNSVTIQQQELEPAIIPITLPPIEETASERASDVSQPMSPMQTARGEAEHDADCGCIVCWLRSSEEVSVDASLEQKENAKPVQSKHRHHHDEPLTLADLCTKHKSPGGDLKVSPARLARAAALPSMIPRPSVSYSNASRRESLGLKPVEPTATRRSPTAIKSLAGAASRAPCRRESLGGSSIPTAGAAHNRRYSLAGGMTAARLGRNAPVATDQRPRYMDYDQSPRFAALKAQNQERRRLAEERSRAATSAPSARPRPSARPPRVTTTGLSLSGASASSAASSPCSSTSSAASLASLASSLPSMARRLRQRRSIST